MSPIESVRCPQCGANILPEGEYFKCDYCGVSLHQLNDHTTQIVLPGDSVQVSTPFPNETEILDRLGYLVRAPEEGDYLIVAADPYYVQFLVKDDPQSLYCEAISSQYLPPEKKLSVDQDLLLKQFGFRINSSGNYARDFKVPDREALEALARLTAQILAEVYGVAAGEKISFDN